MLTRCPDTSTYGFTGWSMKMYNALGKGKENELLCYDCNVSPFFVCLVSILFFSHLLMCFCFFLLFAFICVLERLKVFQELFWTLQEELKLLSLQLTSILSTVGVSV